MLFPVRINITAQAICEVNFIMTLVLKASSKSPIKNPSNVANTIPSKLIL